MASNLVPPQAADTTVFEGEGGAYYVWTPATSPLLAEAKLGSGKMVLQPRGFALPHYSDSVKIGYVIQGTCTVGLIFPNSREEKIVLIKTGDVIPVPLGTVSWWFNGGDSKSDDFIIIFLGQATLSHNPGAIDYFFLTGAIGLLGGFSSEFTAKIYDITDDESQTLAKSQANALVYKLDNTVNLPNEPNCKKEQYVYQINGEISEITGVNFPLLDTVGMSANFVKLGPNSVLAPSYSSDGSYRMIYVIKGSGRIQIVGLNGARILDAKVEKDHFFVVPKFFAIAQIADGEGLEFFSATTSSRPEIVNVLGKFSPWKALSSSALQASLNVEPKFLQFFKSKIEHGEDK